MAAISGIFHQEKQLERAAELLQQSGFSHFFVTDRDPATLPVPGSFFVSTLHRDRFTENNFGVSPGVPLPVFQPSHSGGMRLVVQVKQGEKNQAIGLLRRSKAEQIQIH